MNEPIWIKQGYLVHVVGRIEGFVELDYEGHPIMIQTTDGEKLTRDKAKVLCSARVMNAIKARAALRPA